MKLWSVIVYSSISKEGFLVKIISQECICISQDSLTGNKIIPPFYIFIYGIGASQNIGWARGMNLELGLQK